MTQHRCGASGPCSGAWPAPPSMRPRQEGALRAGATLSPALLLLLLLPLLGHLWAASTPAQSSLSPGTQEDNQLGAGRVKRGWVWNQFFVVEEYTGTEPLYVGKVKWGPDSGDTRPWVVPVPDPFHLSPALYCLHSPCLSTVDAVGEPSSCLGTVGTANKFTDWIMSPVSPGHFSGPR